MESPENDGTVFRPSHKPWKSIKRFPHSHRHDDDEDELNILKPGPLRDTHSEGKVIKVFSCGVILPKQWRTMCLKYLDS